MGLDSSLLGGGVQVVVSEDGTVGGDLWRELIFCQYEGDFERELAGGFVGVVMAASPVVAFCQPLEIEYGSVVLANDEIAFERTLVSGFFEVSARAASCWGEEAELAGDVNA